MASRDMDGRAWNSLETRVIVAVKVHQSQKKLFLLAASLCLCVWYKIGSAEFLHSRGEVAP